jgi:CheY-like chemotaxis protein
MVTIWRGGDKRSTRRLLSHYGMDRESGILVVDDEPDVADLFRQRFRREARQGTYVMHFAASGTEALERLRRCRSTAEAAAISRNGVSLSVARLWRSWRRWRQSGRANFVFPGGRQGRPISNMAMLMTLRRMGRDDLTIHGFRSSFSDWCAERTKSGAATVPTNSRSFGAFRDHVVRLWGRTLRCRSQKHAVTWERMGKLADAWLPLPRIPHPWPSIRFAVKHPR